MSLELLAGLSALAERYDAFILDLWGVAHDGRRPYPGALDCLARLGALGKPRLFLSNAPRRATVITPYLAAMGIAAGEHYDDLLSSGDIAHAALAQRADPWHASLGRRYYHLGPARDEGIMEGLDYQAVAEPGAADFILATGLFDDEHESVEDYRELIARGVERGLPMVCVNPDLTVMRGDLELVCAGSIAAAYAAAGGEVAYHGKPHAPAYLACLERLPGIDRRRILAVGDTLRTDIKGALCQGIDAVLVVGGIHAAEFLNPDDGTPDITRIAAACAREEARPTGVLAGLTW